MRKGSTARERACWDLAARRSEHRNAQISLARCTRNLRAAEVEFLKRHNYKLTAASLSGRKVR